MSNLPSIIVNAKQNEDDNVLTTGESGYWGMQFRWVKFPKDFPSMAEAEQWCSDRFVDSDGMWFTRDNSFFFETQEQATAFLLRWGNL